jgi:hypothetical protein
MSRIVLSDPAPVGDPQGLSLSTGSVYTLTIDAEADGVLLQAIGQDIRYTLTGTNPSASGTPLGFLLYAGADPLRVPVHRDTVIKVVRTAAGAELQYQGVRNG